MQNLNRGFLLAMAASFLLAAPAFAQDQPSLGDVARQARQKKQQAKDAQASDAQGKPAEATKPTKVITEDEMPDGAAPEMNSPDSSKSHADADSPAAASGKLSADEWRSKIQAQKSTVDSLQSNIDELNKSIQFAPGNCVSGCVEWNEHQKQKQQEVEQMKGQLETAKKHLEEMQDAARQQGYGSSVYEP
jgi:predicted RNase H-like nuclease (RuvC/YqgF family)